MVAWIEDGLRVDIALAVVMEISALQLQRADNPRSWRVAQEFNQDLWRTVSVLAARAPVAADCKELGEAVQAMTLHAQDVQMVIGVNIAFARRLAGRAATAGALRQILADWKAFRVATASTEFGRWLLDRLESLDVQDLRRAA